MLGIVIPTMNRSDLLAMQLDYYATVGCKHTIYIGDSSEGTHLKRTEAAIQALSDRLRIVHVPLPGANDHEAISELLQRVQEPYSAFAGDDDFLIPGSLEMCANFLESHQDFSMAHGVAAACGLKSNGSDLQLTGSWYYRLGFLEHQSAQARLIAYFGNYFETLFSVHRTEEFRKDMLSVVSMADRTFRILPVSSLPIIRGKTKQLDCFYMVRLNHERVYRLPDVLDWMTGPHWAPSYEVFCDLLSQALVEQENTDLDSARGAVKQAFWTYLSRSLMKDWHALYGPDRYRNRNRLRRAARRIPALRTALHSVRSHLPGNQNRFSLAAMLRRSSPYHADFMPIYRAITAPTNELPGN